MTRQTANPTLPLARDRDDIKFFAQDPNELSRWRDNVDMWETVITHMDRMQKNMESMGPGMMHGHGMGGSPPTPPNEKKPE
jgi:hypothetical protein